MAENCTGTLHNLYTLRGAEVRDGAAWAGYITETRSSAAPADGRTSPAATTAPYYLCSVLGELLEKPLGRGEIWNVNLHSRS